ncbi:MAG: polysaccharide pyruvyl transferase family protein [Planctomycetota bacterium]
MMDLVLQAWTGGLIELSKLSWLAGDGGSWAPGRPLRLLFAGYNGTRNTGSDVRVEELLRQVRTVLGEGNVRLAVMTQDFHGSRGYFGDAEQVHLPDLFPPFLYREVPKYDGVVACEGSMFKSKFADALTTMMIGSLGVASARNRLSVGYGAEAGAMSRTLARMVRRYCADSFVLTRNEESRALLAKLGVPAESGTDTAWTFEPREPEAGGRLLRAAGWDGATPVLAVCPINPFWWPVRPSLVKAALRALFGGYRESHYRSIYFHASGARVEEAYERYLTGIAGAVDAFRRGRKLFPVLVAMERLDARACARLSEKLGGLPQFPSDRYDMHELVSLLRRADLMVSSRYHGVVTSMPALVASAGITMDERIRNLMRERGHDHLLLSVDEPGLKEKLVAVLETLEREREAVREGTGRTVVRHLRIMARMGLRFEEHVRQRFPEFPARTGVRSWEDYLPPLSEGLRRLVETYGG